MINKLIGDTHWNEFPYIVEDFLRDCCGKLVLDESERVKISSWDSLTRWLIQDLAKYTVAISQNKVVNKDYQTVYKLYLANKDFLVEKNNSDSFKYIKDHIVYLIERERLVVDNLDNLLLMDNLNFLWLAYIRALVKKESKYMIYGFFLILILIAFFGYEKSQEKSREAIVIKVEERVYQLSKTLKKFYLFFSTLPFILVLSGGVTYVAFFGFSEKSLIEGLKLLFLLSPLIILATINVVFVLVLNKKSFNEGEAVKLLILSYEGEEIKVPYNQDIPIGSSVTVVRSRFLGKTYYRVIEKR